jgi:hypothetical protein
MTSQNERIDEDRMVIPPIPGTRKRGACGVFSWDGTEEGS